MKSSIQAVVNAITPSAPIYYLKVGGYRKNFISATAVSLPTCSIQSWLSDVIMFRTTQVVVGDKHEIVFNLEPAQTVWLHIILRLMPFLIKNLKQQNVKLTPIYRWYSLICNTTCEELRDDVYQVYAYYKTGDENDNKHINNVLGLLHAVHYKHQSLKV